MSNMKYVFSNTKMSNMKCCICVCRQRQYLTEGSSQTTRANLSLETSKQCEINKECGERGGELKLSLLLQPTIPPTEKTSKFHLMLLTIRSS